LNVLLIFSHLFLMYFNVRAHAGKWRPRSSSLRLEHEGVTLACAAALVKKRVYRDLVDFDNHLDDLSQVCRNQRRVILRIWICLFFVSLCSGFLFLHDSATVWVAFVSYWYVPVSGTGSQPL
jgi:Uncharacterised protein family (UPF0172)